MAGSIDLKKLAELTDKDLNDLVLEEQQLLDMNFRIRSDEDFGGDGIIFLAMR